MAFSSIKTKTKKNFTPAEAKKIITEIDKIYQRFQHDLDDLRKQRNKLIEKIQTEIDQQKIKNLSANLKK